MSATCLHICSFCEKPVRFAADQALRRGKCPHCSRVVVLLENKSADCQSQLESKWFYEQQRLLRATQTIGPVDDVVFLNLVQQGKLDAATPVMSPQLTRGEWLPLRQLRIEWIEQMIDQRSAEAARIQRAVERRRRADAENRAKLQRAIRGAVESGSISSSHRRAIEDFAIAAGIPADEVSNTIARESDEVIRVAVAEALLDGILEPAEEQQISQLAVSLGVQLVFDDDQQRRIQLCQLAYDIASAKMLPLEPSSAPFRLGPKEELMGRITARWHEIVTLKRPQGIPLGSDLYLRELGYGDCYLTTRQLTLVGDLKSQKLTLSSVLRVQRFCDGILLNRSSGKSVFLQFSVLNSEGGRFALVAEHLVSGDPVLGVDPPENFIPAVVDAEAAPLAPPKVSSRKQVTANNPAQVDLPRYTFRVVGDHVGNRSDFIRTLRPGDALRLIREPSNPYDSNAVAVYDSSQRQLGYLKREVAAWFSSVMTRKPAKAWVSGFTESGSLLVGVDV